MLLYHYTTGMKIRGILDDQQINSSPVKPKPREKAVTWLSCHPVWELTANKVAIDPQTEQQRLLTKAEMIDLAGGLYRVVFDTDSYPDEILRWPKLGVASRMNAKIKGLLLKKAKLAGVKPENWYGVVGPMDTRYMVGVEHWDTSSEEWLPVDLSELNPELNSNVVDGQASIAVDSLFDQWGKVQ